ncbi:hypothetical protein MRB53_003799 [Persea americana]|uniref:Uncharacterized protein n=1 Tax=Persea americana TaxID=3435 RepID=A0ACC2MYK9_PERAE|nr:hypothetical protein MRB53_003799 [Persea americana]
MERLMKSAMDQKLALLSTEESGEEYSLIEQHCQEAEALAAKILSGHSSYMAIGVGSRLQAATSSLLTRTLHMFSCSEGRYHLSFFEGWFYFCNSLLVGALLNGVLVDNYRCNGQVNQEGHE